MELTPKEKKAAKTGKMCYTLLPDGTRSATWGHKSKRKGGVPNL